MKLLFLTLNKKFPDTLFKNKILKNIKHLVTDSLKELTESLSSQNIIIIDMLLPKHDAIKACKEIRKKDSNSYIIIRSDEIENYTKIAAYTSGCNSFIPFNMPADVLAEKIKSINSLFMIKDEQDSYSYKEFSISFKTKEIIKNNISYQLPKIQFKIFTLLTQNPGVVFSNKEIYNYAWEKHTKVDTAALYVHLRGIRTNLSTDYIKTLRGIGYKVLK